MSKKIAIMDLGFSQFSNEEKLKNTIFSKFLSEVCKVYLTLDKMVSEIFSHLFAIYGFFLQKDPLVLADIFVFYTLQNDFFNLNFALEFSYYNTMILIH